MSFSRGIGRKRTGIGAEMLPVSERRRLACALLRDWACFFAWVASRRSTPVLCDDLLVVTESPARLLPPGYCYRNPQEVPNFLETNTTYVCGTGPEPVTRKYSNAFLMGIRNSLRLSSSGFAQLVRVLVAILHLLRRDPPTGLTLFASLVTTSSEPVVGVSTRQGLSRAFVDVFVGKHQPSFQLDRRGSTF
jgi:hypothetical protein